ncbi:MAG: hypothetical protein NTU63_02925 [Candidatus Pacearchaeota archaeon]|nr:hypothetical protein [Candidatus Pacearchaeota archaeon]
MTVTKILQQGAEAKIIQEGDLIIKDRIKKSYRIKELDEKIRKGRTKSETKLLEKASQIIDVPKPVPIKEFNIIKMPFIQGKKLSEDLDSFPLEKQKEICRKIGENIAKLHDKDIIHGDLTTSNMIFVENQETNSASQMNDLTVNKHNTKEDVILTKDKRRNLAEPVSEQHQSASDSERIKIFFIDFGLGFISRKFEDKAVDLHLLKQALEARHFKQWEVLFEEVLSGYKPYKDSAKVLERLKAVEKRGRYKEH